jgi:hypothetical protein
MNRIHQASFRRKIVSFPCTSCERENHGECVEEKLRKSGHISGSSIHCLCFFNLHNRDSIQKNDSI